MVVSWGTGRGEASKGLPGCGNIDGVGSEEVMHVQRIDIATVRKMLDWHTEMHLDYDVYSALYMCVQQCMMGVKTYLIISSVGGPSSGHRELFT